MSSESMDYPDEFAYCRSSTFRLAHGPQAKQPLSGGHKASSCRSPDAQPPPPKPRRRGAPRRATTITVFLYANEHPVPGLAPTTAALIGTGIELVCPILLVFGLATRFAAIPLLLTGAFLQLTYKDLADHLYWMALLGLLIFRGPGALSVDHLIAPHLAGSAIPFGSSLRRIAAFKQRFLLPPK